MSSLIDPFQLPFMQNALLELLLLAPLAGLLGAHIVLRGLAFFTHAVGIASFPGLVLAGPLGVPAAAMALATASLFAGALEAVSRFAQVSRDTATGLLLVGALAIGVILASDVFESGAEVDQLLFGSLLAIGGAELRMSAAALSLAAVAACVFRRAWIAGAFDPANTRPPGLPARAADLVLLAAIGVAVVAALDAVGALLVSAILVIPAATARLFARRLVALEVGAAALALAEGAVGLWLAYRLDVPPGAAIATLSGMVFLICLAAQLLSANTRPAAKSA